VFRSENSCAAAAEAAPSRMHPYSRAGGIFRLRVAAVTCFGLSNAASTAFACAYPPAGKTSRRPQQRGNRGALLHKMQVGERGNLSAGRIPPSRPLYRADGATVSSNLRPPHLLSRPSEALNRFGRGAGCFSPRQSSDCSPSRSSSPILAPPSMASGALAATASQSEF
jgi:hypothetical protein